MYFANFRFPCKYNSKKAVSESDYKGETTKLAISVLRKEENQESEVIIHNNLKVKSYYVFFVAKPTISGTV